MQDIEHNTHQSMIVVFIIAIIVLLSYNTYSAEARVDGDRDFRFSLNTKLVGDLLFTDDDKTPVFGGGISLDFSVKLTNELFAAVDSMFPVLWYMPYYNVQLIFGYYLRFASVLELKIFVSSGLEHWYNTGRNFIDQKLMVILGGGVSLNVYLEQTNSHAIILIISFPVSYTGMPGTISSFVNISPGLGIGFSF